MRYSRVPRVKATTLGMLATESGTEAGNPRHCLECGKPIIHRRITALYCSGKCREIHNAQKRRQIRNDAKDNAPALRDPERDAGLSREPD